MKTLAQAVARDLMPAPVITLPQDTTISEALALCEDEGIRGVPVVDEAGHVVGVLSQDDVARDEHLRKDRLEAGRDWSFGEPDENLENEEREILAREDYSPETLGRDTVADWMNPRLIAVAPATPLKAVCEVLRRDGIHRVLVMERRHFEGIITSSDVVAWLAEHA
jgi:CBS domain-containing protein